MDPAASERNALETVIRRMHQNGTYDKCAPVEMKIDGVTYLAQISNWPKMTDFAIRITKSAGAWHIDWADADFDIPVPAIDKVLRIGRVLGTEPEAASAAASKNAGSKTITLRITYNR